MQANVSCPKFSGVIVDPQVGVNQVNVTWTVGNSHLFQITGFIIEANALLDPSNNWTVVVSNLNINETQQLFPSGKLIRSPVKQIVTSTESSNLPDKSSIPPEILNALQLLNTADPVHFC